MVSSARVRVPRTQQLNPLRQSNESVGCGRWIKFAKQESCLVRIANIQDDNLSGDLVGPMEVLDLLVQKEKTFEKMVSSRKASEKCFGGSFASYPRS